MTGGVRAQAIGEIDDHLRALSAGLPPIVRLEIELRAVDPVLIPGWTGSMLHGALDGALRAVACSRACEARHGEQPDRCAAARLLDGRRVEAAGLGGMSVPGLTIVPGAPAGPRVLEPGASFRFELVLLGSATDDLEVLTAALERASGRGLGRHRGRLRLKRVRDGALDLYDRGRVVESPNPLAPAQWAPIVSGGSVHLRARTPLHVSHGGRLRRAPRTEDLVGAALRRLACLAAARGAGAVDLHVADLGERLASRAGAAIGRWEPFRTERWSSRQGRRHVVTGALGELWLAEAGPAAAPLLWAASVGIGKGTAMGLGAIDVRWIPPGGAR